MFTGIIRERWTLRSAVDGPGFMRLVFAVPDVADLADGDSVAINGCCLTVAEIGGDAVHFDVIPETLLRTNLGGLLPGDRVHAERSLRAGDRIDGHFVQGHIDGLAMVEEVRTEGEWRMVLRVPAELADYLTPKGSVALDGVSLTIAAVEGSRFEVALIPTTLSLTMLGERGPKYGCNLECDMMAKTVVAYLKRTRG